MEPNYKYRAATLQDVGTDEGKHTFAFRACTYNVVDTYNETFEPGLFSEGLKSSLPVACWSHDWTRPWGKVTNYREDATGLDIIGEFADLDAVPDAKMAYSLLKDGIITEVSVGYQELESTPDATQKGVVRVLKGQLAEISPVVKGAIPGSRVLAVRAPSMPRVAADDLLERVALGEITAEEALEELATKSASYSAKIAAQAALDASKAAWVAVTDMEIAKEQAAIDRLLREI